MADTTAMFRQWKLLLTLGARRHGVSLRDLAAELTVSQRTVQRDLRALRDIGFPLAEVTESHGRKLWKATAVDGLPNLSLTFEEAAALYLGRQFLEPLAGTSFFAGAQRAFQKIRSTLGENTLRYLQKSAATFYHRTHGFTDYSRQATLIDQLMIAVEDSQLTAIEYQSLRTTEPVTHYDVEPYALIYYRGALYLQAYSKDHGEIRTFKVDRILGAESLKLRFNRPADYDPAAMLTHSFGIFSADGSPVAVRVRFSATVVRLLEERRFHESQQLSKQSDGSVIAEFRLATLEEFRNWLLSFGWHAEVLSPASLREEMQQTIEKMRERYLIPRVESQARAKRKAAK